MPSSSAFSPSSWLSVYDGLSINRRRYAIVTPPHDSSNSRTRAARPSRLAAAFVLGPFRLDTLAPAIGDQRIVAGDEFLDLHRVVRERLGGGIDRSQAAADD